MLNVYCGDIIERTRDLYPMRNTMSSMYTRVYKKNAILVEIKENKFVDIDDLFLDNKKILNVYSFYEGEYYVDVRSLVNIRDIKEEKTYIKSK